MRLFLHPRRFLLLLALIAALAGALLLLLPSAAARGEDHSELQRRWLEAEGSSDPLQAATRWKKLLADLPAGTNIAPGISHDDAARMLFTALLKAAAAQQDPALLAQAEQTASGWPRKQKLWATLLIARAYLPFDRAQAWQRLSICVEMAQQLATPREKSNALHGVIVTALAADENGRLIFGWDGPELAEQWTPSLLTPSHRAEALHLLALYGNPPEGEWLERLRKLLKISLDRAEDRNKRLMIFYGEAKRADQFNAALDALSGIEERGIQQKELSQWFAELFRAEEYSRAQTIAQRLEDGVYAAKAWGMLAKHYAKRGETGRVKAAQELALAMARDDLRPLRRAEALLEAAKYLAESGARDQAQHVIFEAEAYASPRQKEKLNATLIKSYAENGNLEEALALKERTVLKDPKLRVTALNALVKALAEHKHPEEAFALLKQEALPQHERTDKALYAIAKAFVGQKEFDEAQKAARMIDDGKMRAKAQQLIAGKRRNAAEEEEEEEEEAKTPTHPLSSDAGDPSAHALALMQSGDTERALAAAKAIEDAVLRRRTFRTMAEILARRTDFYGLLGSKPEQRALHPQAHILSQAAAIEESAEINAFESKMLDTLRRSSTPGIVARALPQENQLGHLLPAFPDAEKLHYSGATVAAMLPMPAPFLLRRVYYENSFFINTKFKLTIGHALANAAEGIAAPDLLYLESGVATLPQLYDTLRSRGIDDYLVKEDGRYLLRRALLVGPQATLAITGPEVKELRLEHTHSAILVNAGTLYIHGVEVAGWDEKESRPTLAGYEQRYDLRPFIASWSRSHTYLADSDFIALGYNNHKSYGISLSAGPEKMLLASLYPPVRPDGIIADNRFENLYYGFYSYEADNAALVGNLYERNVVYGIAPHDRSRWLTMAYNTAYDTEKKHGIIVSREVNDSSYIGNLSFDNHGSGFMVDRMSHGTYIYGNTALNNGQDGLTLFESSCNLVASNNFSQNGRMGVRVRNALDNGVFFNLLENNHQGGLYIYNSDLIADSSHEHRNFAFDPYVMLTSASAVGNRIAANDAGIMGDSVTAMTLKGNQFIDQSPRLLEGEWFRRQPSLASQYDLAGRGAATIERCPQATWRDFPCRFRDQGIFNGDGQRALPDYLSEPHCEPAPQGGNA